jgi:serine/threonine protein kinase
LRHPGIVTVHDVVTYEGKPWIVMELIEGRSLADVLHEDGPLPVDRAAEIGIKVIEALDSAHRQGVLHRDVKPGNIMLDGERVVLTDFGIAAIDGATALTGTGQLVGSPEFMAPERYESHEANHAADLWSVGITLYCMVVGRTPFKRETTMETFAAISTREPDPDPAVGTLWPVIQGLLRKKAPQRISADTAKELLREVSGKPAPPPLVKPDLPRFGGPTHVDHAQATVENDTVRNTRMPVPLPFNPDPMPPPAGHGDITLDPVPQPPRPGRGRIVVVAVLAVAALVAVVIVAVVHGGGDSGATQTASQSGSSPTTAPPLPVFTSYQEPLGFTIEVPRNYVRQASAVGALSDVEWQATQRDPAIGALVVQVQRDDTQPGISPIGYLTAKDESERTDGSIVGYQRTSLTGEGAGSAALEYTHGDPASGDLFHVRSQAVSGGGHLYVLTFSLYAQDAATLRAQWFAAQPVIARIRDGFRVTS